MVPDILLAIGDYLLEAVAHAGSRGDGIGAGAFTNMTVNPDDDAGAIGSRVNARIFRLFYFRHTAQTCCYETILMRADSNTNIFPGLLM